MESSERTPILLSLFKPLVTVDDVEGQWFAVASDGSTCIQVLEWPLWDQWFQPEASAVFTIELFMAEDQAAFLSGEGRRFAQVHVPAEEVRCGREGGLLRSWFGLQRGCHREEVSLAEARQLYETSLVLARNLLTPKICCSFVKSGLTDRALSEEHRGILWTSLLMHSNMIMYMHRQVRALWAEGQLAAVELPDGGVSAHLVGADEKFCGLEGEVQRLRELLQESDAARLRLEERLKGPGPDASRAGEAEAEAAGPLPSHGELPERVLREEIQSMGLRLKEQKRLRAEDRQRAEELAEAGSALEAEMAELRAQAARERVAAQEALAHATQDSAREASSRDDALDVARGEMDEERSTFRMRLGELREQNQELREELLVERSLKGGIAQGGDQLTVRSLQEEMAQREARLRSELRDLEDANDHLTRQAQKQFDETTALQERISQELLAFRREQELGGAVDLAAALASNEELRRELEDQRAEVAELQARGAGGACNEELSVGGRRDCVASPEARVRQQRGRLTQAVPQGRGQLR